MVRINMLSTSRDDLINLTRQNKCSSSSPTALKLASADEI